MGALEVLAEPRVSRPSLLGPRLRHSIGNLLVAGSFIVAALPNARHFSRSAADMIWTVGAVAMAAMSLVRIAPKASRVDLRAFLSTIFPVFLLPCLLRAENPSSGMLAWTGVTLELCGVALSQLARIYMGRSFGILPGNRGIVSKGPFSLVRHPIYAGWFILTLGYLASYPSLLNSAITLAMLPFMMWRIRMEEDLLEADPDYRRYRRMVPSRLLPGLY
ncbi:MAG TPA: isoprenylcysteine carboxylmethyltransferase family protein [Candidatus Binataceae bacterium]|nr:isoprenylcysteine carboxylmethyltransferase family protein [Candidatus Binataceae bacterium]